MTTTELVQAIKAHAAAHYNEGWDTVVECFEDSDIAEQIGSASTLEEALTSFTLLIEIWNEADRW